MKALLVILFAGLIGAIPLAGFYFLWSWCIAQIPVTLAWAGVAKVGITLVLILVGGGSTIGLALWGAMLAGMFAAALLD